MKSPNNWRMQQRKRATTRRRRTRPQTFRVELRRGLGQHIVLDMPTFTDTEDRQPPGSRIWFTCIDGGILMASRPKGPHGKRRYSSRLLRAHVPFRLVMQYRRARRGNAMDRSSNES